LFYVEAGEQSGVHGVVDEIAGDIVAITARREGQRWRFLLEVSINTPSLETTSLVLSVSFPIML
jgi:hypothetical protein